jgi:hypothetical protein
MSSISRRDLARRRPGRAWGRVPVLLVLLVITIAAAAYLVGRGVL